VVDGRLSFLPNWRRSPPQYYVMARKIVEEVRFSIRRDVSFYGVTLPDGKVVGGVFAIPFFVENSSGEYPSEDFVEVYGLNINKEYRERGYGRRIMLNLIEDFGAGWICLMVEPRPSGMAKEDLIAWYKRLGFVEGSPFHDDEGWFSRVPRASQEFREAIA